MVRLRKTSPLRWDARKRRRQVLARAAGLVFFGFAIYYLLWRATDTLNPNALWFAVPLLAAEAHGVLNFGLFLFMVWDVRPPRLRRPRPGVTVDVFVTTYNEDLEILWATLLGCAAITYPHETYVLDDGRRPEVRALAAKLGCRYIARPTNEHAKAGNINYALSRTRGELLLILDADHVPQARILNRTIGYFRDPQVALVQMPQDFYNLDSIQHTPADSLQQAWHEQAIFYRCIQPGKNRWNAAFWCGSPSVLRREALESVGGVAVESVTEDLLTSLRLHARGWRSVYHPDVLATGLAPDDVEAFLTQRQRWAQGAMQAFRTDNPLWKRGLTLAQRFNYFASMSTYFEAYQKAIYMLAPTIVLLTGILPIDELGWSFAARFIPYMLWGMAANMLAGRGHYRYPSVEHFNVLKTYTFIHATFTLLTGRRLRFRVTRKEGGERNRWHEATLIAPQVLVALATMVGLGIGLTHLFRPVIYPVGSKGAVVAAILWALYNAGLLVAVVKLVVLRRHRRRLYRFKRSLPVAYSRRTDEAPTVVTRTLDITAEGLAVATDEALDYGTPLHVRLALPEGSVSLEAEAVGRARLWPEKGLPFRMGLRITAMGEEAKNGLVRYLFEPQRRPSWPLERKRVSASLATFRAELPVGRVRYLRAVRTAERPERRIA